MHAFEIKLDDFQRVLTGNMPAGFYVEVVLRVLFVFGLIVSCMRLMGKRMAAQLNRNELVALSSLAAAIGIPLQAPDRGLLPAFMVAMVVVGGQYLISALAARNTRFENLTQGYMGILLKDGCLQTGAMRKTRISRARLLAELRCRGFKQLGEVSRVYFEAGGAFTIIPAKTVRPGLSILPEGDAAYIATQPRTEQQVCGNCGTAHQRNDHCCSTCGEEHFVAAVQ